MSDYSQRISAIADNLVRIKFEDYKARRIQQGLCVEYENFDDQPVSLQKSSYAQMAHILSKVDALGYTVAPIEKCDLACRISAFTDEETERLAELEHERWMEERIADGWTVGERNHDAKTTPYLIPYSDLEDSVKQYDRDAVNRVVEFLGMADLAVVRAKDQNEQ